MPNDQKLKVGLVFDDSLDSNDGVAQYVKTLGSWLTSQGHSVSYLVGKTKLTTWQGGKVYSLANNLKVRFNANRLSIPLMADGKKIKSIIAQGSFDVLHIMMPHSPLMAGRIIKHAQNNTVIVGTFHIFPANKPAIIGGKLLRLSYGRSLSRFATFVSVSGAAQFYALQSFGIKSTVVPNCINISMFSSSKLRPQKNRIVFLGRLVKRKGAQNLLEAFSILVKTVPDARLVIAGDGPQRRQLEDLARKKTIDDKVEFLGFINELSKADLLASANIACFPSLYGESFGIVLIEAMAAGSKTVLGGDNPGYRSVLGQQPKLLINPTNTENFAKRLEELLSDDKLSAQLHEWQNQTIAQYDVSKVGNEIVNIYRSAIAHKA